MFRYIRAAGIWQKVSVNCQTKIPQKTTKNLRENLVGEDFVYFKFGWLVWWIAGGPGLMGVKGKCKYFGEVLDLDQAEQ